MSQPGNSDVNQLLNSINQLTSGIDSMMSNLNDIVSKSVASMGDEGREKFINEFTNAKADEKIEEVKKEVENLRSTLNIKL
jgi:uncharacterized protein YllA (UPF0747 family)